MATKGVARQAKTEREDKASIYANQDANKEENATYEASKRHA